jgi:hypothetical protein
MSLLIDERNWYIKRFQEQVEKEKESMQEQQNKAKRR